ncbi:MAG: diacylglycerol kinase family lipid kinase [Chloroflexi bacterium]|nr:diacylglycerol kinase family lipid kinase [Chloroflexota bacterium]
MPAKIILNPYSNRWGAAKQADQVVTILKALNYDFELVQTEAPNQAIGLAKQAVQDGFDPVVAAGGDGTINEVVNGLLAEADVSRVRLGVLPLGSANDLAYQVGIPLDVEEACRLLVKAEHERVIDAGRINDRAFINDVAIAFGARVNIEAAKIQYLRGALIYLGGVFKALFSYHLPKVTVEWEGGRLEDKAILMAYVGNGWRTGGVFHLTPTARPDDGLFDIVIGDAMNRLQILRLLPKTFNGSHIQDPRVLLIQSTWLRLISDDPLPVLTDGEIIYEDAHELNIRLLPQAVPLICGPGEGPRPQLTHEGVR